MLIYHVDRLTRRPIELEQFLDMLTAAKIRRVRFVASSKMPSWITGISLLSLGGARR